MFELKPISKTGIEEALSKVERYRLLNEPWEAESICLDVLSVDPENQAALVALLLARTDQLRHDVGEAAAALEIVPRLQSDRDRAYYSGIIAERRAKAILAKRSPGAGPIVYDFLQQAMSDYAKAEQLRPGDDSARLRWNTCARIIMRHDFVRPAEADVREMMLE